MAPKDDGTGAAGAATARRHRARARAEGSCNCDGPSGREETRNEESGSEEARCEEGRSERTRGSEETGRREGREGEALTWPDRSTSPLTDSPPRGPHYSRTSSRAWTTCAKTKEA